MISYSKLAGKIDNTILKPTATLREIEDFIVKSKNVGFYSICIPPFFVKDGVKLIEDAGRISTVIGFPNGTSATGTKVFEVEEAVRNGAWAVDVVININALKSGSYSYLENELLLVRKAAFGVELRVIIESCYLTKQEIVDITKLIMKTGCDVVKTSTGFGTGNATLEVVSLLKETTNGSIKIKASGGIKCIDDALSMIASGADILGTSAGLAILDQLGR